MSSTDYLIPLAFPPTSRLLSPAKLSLPAYLELFTALQFASLVQARTLLTSAFALFSRITNALFCSACQTTTPIRSITVMCHRVHCSRKQMTPWMTASNGIGIGNMAPERATKLRRFFFYWLTEGQREEDICYESYPSSSGDAYGYSSGNASDTIFTTGDNICEDQSSALTDNHTTIIDSSSDLVGAATCSASGPSLLSANHIINGCACISCLLRDRKVEHRYILHKCVPGCNYQYSGWVTSDWQAHFKAHFMQDKKYHCGAPQCGQIFKRWGELTRHNKTHCLRPKKFACDVFGCKYSGDNGFIRHDKLLSHKRNVHDGKAPPSQLMRRLQAKPRA